MTVTDGWKILEQEIVDCQSCPRLVEWRETVARKKRRAYQDWDYWGKPVPGFGDYQARVLIVGLAPGAHGANRTGRVFTGDDSGSFLYRALHRVGLANKPSSHSKDDGLQLSQAYITAVCRCAPPDNKPTKEELERCLPFLEREIELMKSMEGIVALGKIAFDQVIKLYRAKEVPVPSLTFSHGAFYHLGKGLPWLLASYHPSRQNTQTGRLTEDMFDQIWKKVKDSLAESSSN